MKKNKAATNWRKRAEEALQEAERARDFWEAHSGDIRRDRDKTIADLRAQLEADDRLFAQQRERLIRLTKIQKMAEDLIGVIAGSWQMSGSETFELDGTKWIRHCDAASVSVSAYQLLTAIAALEVDTAVPPKGARR